MPVAELEQGVSIMEVPFGEGCLHVFNEGPDPQGVCDCLCTRCVPLAVKVSTGGMTSTELAGSRPM